MGSSSDAPLNFFLSLSFRRNKTTLEQNVNFTEKINDKLYHLLTYESYSFGNIMHQADNEYCYSFLCA
jgi:hypothetical protein